MELKRTFQGGLLKDFINLEHETNAQDNRSKGSKKQ
jgi:hypothetical protein